MTLSAIGWQGWYFAARVPARDLRGARVGLPQQSESRTLRRPDVGSWYREYGAAVFRRIRRFYSSQEAEEVLQEVFVRVLRTADGYRGDASPMTWLYQVATRHCLNRLRDARRRQDLLLEHGRPAWSRDVDPSDVEARVFLQQLWREIDEEQALIGVMYFVDGMTHAQIAEAVGVSRRTVGNRIGALQARARAAAGEEAE
ncbi:MAG: RNA polymerase sigma factor (sigma-70 family) [Myxococcota bacterium]